ncbi:MAG: AAA family ATPase, partial [Oscillospiraceae bacterium]
MRAEINPPHGEVKLQDLKRLEGNIAHITFLSQDTGFTVLELDTEEGIITVVGEMAGIGLGQKLIVFGQYATHPSFGVQFKAVSFEVVLPSDANAILLYLSGGAVKGIGPVTAKRIVDAFGDDTFSVLDTEPVKLSEIKGISYRQALEIQSEFKRIYGIQDAIMYLSQYGIQTGQTIALYGIYGANTVEIISNNPYILCGDPCFIPFELADEIATKVSLEYDSDIRIQGGVSYVLRHNTLKGHCCVPYKKLVETVSNFIRVEPEKVEGNIENQCDTGLLMKEAIKGREFIYLADLYVAELISAQKLTQLLQKKQNKAKNIADTIELIEQMENIKYAPKQKEAMEKVMDSNLCIITGGPGTGKTTLVKGIISLFEMQADRVSLCAPTGRAAKRLSELSGRSAKTIHRLLEVVPGSKNNIRFVRNQDNPIRCDVLIVDEFSMVDAVLFSQLITAVKDDCRVVLVGDYNQLPAVGPGNILKDLLDCGLVPSVQLTEIFRQAQQSDIVLNAHAINHGEIPKSSGKKGDYFFLECPPSEAESTIIGLVETRLPKAYGFDSFEDIQVLCPSKKKSGGTVSLNVSLQKVLNPEGANKA